MGGRRAPWEHMRYTDGYSPAGADTSGAFEEEEEEEEGWRERRERRARELRSWRTQAGIRDGGGRRMFHEYGREQEQEQEEEEEDDEFDDEYYASPVGDAEGPSFAATVAVAPSPALRMPTSDWTLAPPPPDHQDLMVVVPPSASSSLRLLFSAVLPLLSYLSLSSSPSSFPPLSSLSLPLACLSFSSSSSPSIFSCSPRALSHSALPLLLVFLSFSSSFACLPLPDPLCALSVSPFLSFSFSLPFSLSLFFLLLC